MSPLDQGQQGAEDQLLGSTRQYRGEILRPGDLGYERACEIYNPRVQGKPAIVARCVGTQDVAAALRVARDRGLEVSVRGGGHSIGGWSSNDGGLVIDLTQMRQVLIDPEARTAWIGGGTLAGDLLVEADRFGLVGVTGAEPSIGVAGLAMGIGEAYLTARLGYASDHLLGFELVTPRGEVLRVDADRHPDLFWALRGAGANFGVVTALKLRLVPAPEHAVGGWITFDGSDSEVLTREIWRVMRHGSEYFAPVIQYEIGESGRLEILMNPGHTGPPELAQREIDRVCELAPPISDERRPGSYLDLVFQEPIHRGRQEWDLLRFPFGNDDERQIQVLLEQARPSGEGGSIRTHRENGKISRTRALGLWRSVAPASPSPGAAPRLQGITVMTYAIWQHEADDGSELGWIQSTTSAFREAGVVAEPANAMNHVSEAEEARVREVYGPVAYDRLSRLKAQYDPENLLHRNFNIPPADPADTLSPTFSARDTGLTWRGHAT